MNRTGPERESDTLCDTLKEEVFTKSLKILEASTNSAIGSDGVSNVRMFL